MKASVELTGLILPLDLGTYGPGDVVPDAHYLDLHLTIAPELALVPDDQMKNVFDYDPLMAEIHTLARDGHYETQEWLITRIAGACARYREIESAAMMVYKEPVLNGSGKLGVRLAMDRDELDALLP